MEKFWLVAFFVIQFTDLGGYIPQIVKLIKSKTRGAGLSLSTWALWSAASIVAFSYTVFINKDPILILLVGLDSLGIMTIFAITLHHKFSHQPALEKGHA